MELFDKRQNNGLNVPLNHKKTTESQNLVLPGFLPGFLLKIRPDSARTFTKMSPDEELGTLHIALRLFGILIKIRNLESAKALIWVAFYSKHLFFSHCIAFDLQVRITKLSCMQHDNCAFLCGKTALSLILN